MLFGLRRIYVYLLAAAFVLNGGLVHASFDLPPALIAHVHVGAAVAAKDVVHHQAAHAGQIEAATSLDKHDHGAMHDHLDSDAKSCGTCGMANAMPELATIPAQLSYATITFQFRLQNLAGHLAKLDPEIPKAIV